jgi:hypothetical protein
MGSGKSGSRRATGLAKHEGGVLPRELPVSLGDHHAHQRLLSPSLSPVAVGILRDTSHGSGSGVYPPSQKKPWHRRRSRRGV